MKLAEQVYEITKSFPDEEKFGLTSQIRRSAVSIPSNIAEGAARNSTSDFIRFLHISLGSLSELETQLILSGKLGFMKNHDGIMDDLTSVRKQLPGLIRSLKNKK